MTSKVSLGLGGDFRYDSYPDSIYGLKSTRNWGINMNDNVDTVGLGIKRKGLFGGKLDLNGDFLYSFARTLIGVKGGQYVQSPKGTAADGPFYYIPAADMPECNLQARLPA